jgi:hypothetical protein
MFTTVGGEARFETIPEQAAVVRDIFEWVGQERCSLGGSAAVFKAPVESPRLGSAFGLGRPYGTFSRIPFIKEPPPMEKRG